MERVAKELSADALHPSPRPRRRPLVRSAGGTRRTSVGIGSHPGGLKRQVRTMTFPANWQSPITVTPGQFQSNVDPPLLVPSRSNLWKARLDMQQALLDA